MEKEKNVNSSEESVITIKENFSSRYNTFDTPSVSEDTSVLNNAVIDLKNEIFDGKFSSSGRRFDEILKTPEELVDEGHYLFSQKDVSKYWSEDEIKKRERTLKKDPLFEPPVVLGKIVPTNQRENRNEGLNRASYNKTLEFAVQKLLFTTGIPPMTQLSNLGKVFQYVTGEKWIDEKEWTGRKKIDDGDIERITAEMMAKKLGIDFEEAILQGQRITALNDSEATFLNENDQHKIPASQGGLSQIPMSIASHWYEHTQVAADAAEVLEILIQEKEKGLPNEKESEEGISPELKELIRLAYFSYQANTPSAELIRHAPALYSSLSNKYILEKRREIANCATLTIQEAELLDEKGWLSLLSDQDKENIQSVCKRIELGKGRVEKDSLLSAEEQVSVSNLAFVSDLIERDTSVNKLRGYLSELQTSKHKKSSISYTEDIYGLIERLENDIQPLYLENLTEREYRAILKLQEHLDRSILIEIATPHKLGSVRPEWKFRLDLDTLRDVTVSPYNESGSEIRKLADVLETPFFNGVLQRPQVPRREALDLDELKDPEMKLASEIYGPTRDLAITEGYTANLIIEKYYRSIGIENRIEMMEMMFPTEKSLQPPSALQNVDKAADLIYKAIINEEKVATIADCDQDGFNSTNNMRWALEKMGVKKVDQKFNSRIEGHSIQLTDLINLAIAGNSLIIISDTGSSDIDTACFQTIHFGTNKTADLQYFLDNIERINGFNKFPEEEKNSMKRIIKLFLGRMGDSTSFVPQILLEKKFISVDPLTKVVSRKPLSSYEPLERFLKGFGDDVRIIVCDHHTPSINSTIYFLNNPEDIMVNPEWVKNGFENIFIQEMNEALQPNEKGEIDHKKLDEVQRKYVCYKGSDIVGTVTTGKVIRRVMNLFSDDPIVRTEANEYLSLSKTEREALLKEILTKDLDNLTPSEQRFVLEQSGNMPKSFFELDTDAKEAWAIEKMEGIVNQLDRRLSNLGLTEIDSTPLKDSVNSWTSRGKYIRDIKKELFDVIETGLTQKRSRNSRYLQPSLFFSEDFYDDYDESEREKKIREKARKIGNLIFDSSMKTMLSEGSLSQNDIVALKSYLLHGPFGLQQLQLLEATATIGDGGSLGLDIGMENRYIVKNAMDELTSLSKRYLKDAKTEWRSRQLARILPESLRFIRIALRDTNFTNVNYYNSRFFSHIMAASTNAIYRRAKAEEAQRADSVLSEISDIFIKKSENEKIRRHRHTLPYAQDKAIQRREELLEEQFNFLDKNEFEREKPILIVELKGKEYIDALQGQRGLIAGSISERYEKPTMVIVEEKHDKINDLTTYSISFRMPGRGNIATDMIQLYLEKNPQPGVKVLAHGGHPLASGGTWEVSGGIDQLHNVLDLLFKDFAIENPDAGVINIEQSITEIKKELKKNSPDLAKVTKYINPFSVADIISTQISNQINPYGTDFPKLLLEFEELKVVAKSRGKKVDGESYQTITVEDTRGNRKTMRLFKKISLFNNIRVGDTVSLRVQPIMRLSPMGPAKLIYNGPYIKEGDVTSIDGQKTNPALDIEKIMSIKRTTIK